MAAEDKRRDMQCITGLHPTQNQQCIFASNPLMYVCNPPCLRGTCRCCRVAAATRQCTTIANIGFNHGRAQPSAACCFCLHQWQQAVLQPGAAAGVNQLLALEAQLNTLLLCQGVRGVPGPGLTSAFLFLLLLLVLTAIMLLVDCCLPNAAAAATTRNSSNNVTTSSNTTSSSITSKLLITCSCLSCAGCSLMAT